MGFRRVLIVDDELELVTALAEVLHKEGYQVLIAADGLTALERFRGDGVDAVVLDVMISGIEGEKLFSFIRTDPRFRHVAVVLCSRLGPQELALLPEVSADAYVAKGAADLTAADVLLALQRLAENGASGDAGSLVLGYERLGTGRPLSRLMTRLRRYQGILSALAEGLIEVDHAGRVLSLNRAALGLAGRPEREALGRPLAEVLGAGAGLAIEQAVARFATSGESYGVIRHRISNADWEITLAGRFEGGRRLGALLVFRQVARAEAGDGPRAAPAPRARWPEMAAWATLADGKAR